MCIFCLCDCRSICKSIPMNFKCKFYNKKVLNMPVHGKNILNLSHISGQVLPMTDMHGVCLYVLLSCRRRLTVCHWCVFYEDILKIPTDKSWRMQLMVLAGLGVVKKYQLLLFACLSLIPLSCLICKGRTPCRLDISAFLKTCFWQLWATSIK